MKEPPTSRQLNNELKHFISILHTNAVLNFSF